MAQQVLQGGHGTRGGYLLSPIIFNMHTEAILTGVAKTWVKGKGRGSRVRVTILKDGQDFLVLFVPDIEVFEFIFYYSTQLACECLNTYISLTK